MTGEPEVFIIESVKWKEEKESLFEGPIIKEILAMSGKRCRYYYIRTEREFQRVLQEFDDSQCRYLHLACHADPNSMLTTLDTIDLTNVATILAPHLNERRLFLSACEMSNDKLAAALMPNSKCYSILGPDTKVDFHDAAILWASLYHVLFAVDYERMKGATIKAKAQEVATMYRVSLQLYRRKASDPEGYSSSSIRPEVEVDD